MKPSVSPQSSENQNLWEDSPGDISLTLGYLRDLCNQNDVEAGKMVLSKSWLHLESNQEFVDALLQEPIFLQLLPHLQLLTWKGNPENSKDGLTAVQGFLLQENMIAAEESLDILLNASERPMEILIQLQGNSQFNSILTFATQRAIQYNARNSIKKRNEIKQPATEKIDEKIEDLGDGYTRDQKEIYCDGKKLNVADINDFEILGGGYSTDNRTLFYKNTILQGNFGVNSQFQVSPHGFIFLKNEELIFHKSSRINMRFRSNVEPNLPEIIDGFEEIKNITDLAQKLSDLGQSCVVQLNPCFEKELEGMSWIKHSLQAKENFSLNDLNNVVLYILPKLKEIDNELVELLLQKAGVAGARVSNVAPFVLKKLNIWNNIDETTFNKLLTDVIGSDGARNILLNIKKIFHVKQNIFLTPAIANTLKDFGELNFEHEMFKGIHLAISDPEKNIIIDLLQSAGFNNVAKRQFPGK